MSQSSNHLRLVSWTWQWVHFTQMASTVPRSQSNRAPLRCGGTGDRIMDVQLTNLQQLRDAIMSIWTKFSEECFQHLVESMPRRIKAVLKANVQPGTSKVYLIKWPVSVYIYIKMTRKLFSTFYIYSWILMFGETEYDWHIDFNTFTLQMGLKLLKCFNPNKFGFSNFYLHIWFV